MIWRRKKRKAEQDTSDIWIPEEWNDAKEQSFLESLEEAAQRDAPPMTDQPLNIRTR